MSEDDKILPTAAAAEVLSLQSLCERVLPVLADPYTYSMLERARLAEAIHQALACEKRQSERE